MKARTRVVLLNSVKVVLAAAAMICLGELFLYIPSPWAVAGPIDPVEGPGELAGTLSWFSWIWFPATYLAGVLVASTLSGMLFRRDRWIVRPAVLLWVLLLSCGLVLFAIDASRDVPGPIIFATV